MRRRSSGAWGQQEPSLTDYASRTFWNRVADAAEAIGMTHSARHVKPQGEGASIGVTKVDSLFGLRDATERALKHDDCVLVERYVRGAEVCVGLLDGRVLGAIEVVPRGEFYDYASKYTPGGSEYSSPPRLAPTRGRGVMNLAERAARAIGCQGACRVDLLVTEGENE